MAIDSVWALHSVKVRNETDLVIGGIVSQSIDPGIQQYLGGDSGGVDPKFSAVLSTDPAIRFSTVDIQAALAVVSFNVGLALVDPEAGSPVFAEFYFKRRESGGEFRNDNLDLSLKVASGILLPGPITVSVGGEATMEMTCIPVWNQRADPDSKSPIVVSTTTVPATAPQIEVFGIGPVLLNETFMDSGISEMTIDPGLEIRAIHGTDGAWPGAVFIVSRRPRVEFTALDANLIKDTVLTIGLDGSQFNDPGVTVWLRQYKGVIDGGLGHFDDDEEEHPEFLMRQTLGEIQSIGGSSDADAGVRVTLTATKDDANPIMAFTPDTKID